MRASRSSSFSDHAQYHSYLVVISAIRDQRDHAIEILVKALEARQDEESSGDRTMLV